MPLIRGIARVAAISGTATAVSNRVSRRQAQKLVRPGPGALPAGGAPAGRPGRGRAGRARPDPAAQGARPTPHRWRPHRRGVRGREGQGPRVLSGCPAAGRGVSAGRAPAAASARAAGLPGGAAAPRGAAHPHAPQPEADPVGPVDGHAGLDEAAARPWPGPPGGAGACEGHGSRVAPAPRALNGARRSGSGCAHHRGSARLPPAAAQGRMTQRKPMWLVEVSTASNCRAAGRNRRQ